MRSYVCALVDLVCRLCLNRRYCGLALLMGCLFAFDVGCVAPVTPFPSRPAVTALEGFDPVTGTWQSTASSPVMLHHLGMPAASLQTTPEPTPPPMPTPGTSTGAVVGQVWEDLNGNGRFEPEEPPLTGVRLILAQGACQEFARFMDATVSGRGGIYEFDFPIPESPTVSIVAMAPTRFQTTTPSCQTVTFQETDSEPRNVDFGARRLWDEPVRASFLLGEEGGDAIWVGVSGAELAEELAAYEEGRNWWFCGRVVPDSLLEWGFDFEPGTSFLGEITAEGQQTTLRFIAADPVFFAESPLPAWCIRLYAVHSQLAGPFSASVFLPYIARQVDR